MKSQKIKDNNCRKSFSKHEAKRALLKYLILQKNIEDSQIGSSVLSDNWRQRAEQLQKMSRNSSKSRIRNRCVLTNRPRSISRLFKISRQELRRLSLNGKIPGVKRSTW